MPGDKFRKTAGWFAAAIAIVLGAAAGASAQLSDFVIDPSQSYITAVGSAYVHVEQFPGSLTTQLFGDLLVDQQAPGTLDFSSFTSIGLQTQATGSLPRGTPAQISGRLLNYPSQALSANFAFRGVTIGMTNYTTSITGDNFNLFGSIFNFATGTSTVTALGIPATDKSPLISTGVSTTGTIQPTAGGEQITIPFSFYGYIGLNPTNPQLRTTFFEGQIVANYNGPQTLPPGVQKTDLAASSLVYSPQDHHLYASTGATAQHPNGGIVQIDPTSGALGTFIDMNSAPSKLVVSGDGSTIHAVTNGGAVVQRFNVAQSAVDLQFALGGTGEFTEKVASITAINGQPDEVLISRTLPGFSPPQNGTAIYKDGVPLPDGIGTNIPGAGPTFSTVDPTGQTMYGDQNLPPGFWLASVTANGLETTFSSSDQSKFSGFGNGQIAAGKLFTTGGGIYDLTTGVQLGSFLGSGNYMIDAADNRLLSLTNTVAGWVVRAYDLTSLALLGSETIPVITGQTFDLTRWGTNGLAFRDANEVYTIETSLVPEPSTFAIAALGGLLMVAAGLRHRNQCMLAALARRRTAVNHPLAAD